MSSLYWIFFHNNKKLTHIVILEEFEKMKVDRDRHHFKHFPTEIFKEAFRPLEMIHHY